MTGYPCPSCGHPLSEKQAEQLARASVRCEACSATLRMDRQRRVPQVVPGSPPARPARKAEAPPPRPPAPAPELRPTPPRAAAFVAAPAPVSELAPGDLRFEAQAETPPPVAVPPTHPTPARLPASLTFGPRRSHLVGLAIAVACAALGGTYAVMHGNGSAPAATVTSGRAPRVPAPAPAPVAATRLAPEAAPAPTPTPAPTEAPAPAEPVAAAQPRERVPAERHRRRHPGERSRRGRGHPSERAEAAPREVAAAEPQEKGESESGAGVERKSLLATRQLSAADAASRAYELYKSGSALLLSGDAPAAAEAYLNALRTDPKGAAGYRGLGLAYAEMGNSAAAIRYLRHYLKLAGSAPDRNLIVKRVRLMVLAAHEE